MQFNLLFCLRGQLLSRNDLQISTLQQNGQLRTVLVTEVDPAAEYSAKMFRKLEPSCNFDNHQLIVGNSTGLSYSLSHVDLSKKLEYNGGSNQQNNCSKQVKRATSYVDMSTLGKEMCQGKITGPYMVSIILHETKLNDDD